MKQVGKEIFLEISTKKEPFLPDVSSATLGKQLAHHLNNKIDSENFQYNFIFFKITTSSKERSKKIFL